VPSSSHESIGQRERPWKRQMVPQPQVRSGWSIPLSAWDSSVAATGMVWTAWMACMAWMASLYAFHDFNFLNKKQGFPIFFIFYFYQKAR